MEQQARNTRAAGYQRAITGPTVQRQPMDRVIRWAARLERFPLLLCGLLLLSVLVTFGPVLGNGFLSYDDPVYVTQNAIVRRGLTREGLLWALGSGAGGSWHPVTWLSHMLDCQLYGLKPVGHHLTSLLLHAANTALLFLVLRRTTAAVWLSALVAALFALHPLHVESVAWVAERKDVLSTFFLMLTLMAYVKYVTSHSLSVSPLRPGLWYGLALLCFTLGLMSKPMLVTLPFVLLLLDYWPLCRLQPGPPVGCPPSSLHRSPTPRMRLVLEKLPFLLLSILASGVAFRVQHSGGMMGSLAMFPLPLRLANALMSYAAYLRKAVVPCDLAVFYPYPQGWPPWQLVGAACLLAAISGAAVKWGARHRYLVAGWLIYLGVLVPVIGLVQVGSQCMADRYTYFPLVGVFIMLAWGGGELARHFGWHRHGLLVLPAGAILLGCVFASRAQLAYWKTTESLFAHALAVTRNNYVAHTELGVAWAGQGKTNEALAAYAAALHIKPDYAPALDEMGNLMLMQGDARQALTQYAAAAQSAPTRPEPEYHQGLAALKLGRPHEAVAHYRAALRLKPDYAPAHYSLGIALAKSGQTDEAIGHLNRALELGYAPPNVHEALGNTYAERGEMRQAIREYRQALRVQPNTLGALNNLAWILATANEPDLRDGSEAVQLSARAVELTRRQSLRELDTLAASYAETGQFTDAIKTAEEALALNSASGLNGAVTELEAHRNLYLAHQSLRDRGSGK